MKYLLKLTCTASLNSTEELLYPLTSSHYQMQKGFLKDFPSLGWVEGKNLPKHFIWMWQNETLCLPIYIVCSNNSGLVFMLALRTWQRMHLELIFSSCPDTSKTVWLCCHDPVSCMRQVCAAWQPQIRGRIVFFLTLNISAVVAHIPNMKLGIRVPVLVIFRCVVKK